MGLRISAGGVEGVFLSSALSVREAARVLLSPLGDWEVGRMEVPCLRTGRDVSTKRPRTRHGRVPTRWTALCMSIVERHVKVSFHKGGNAREDRSKNKERWFAPARPSSRLIGLTKKGSHPSDDFSRAALLSQTRRFRREGGAEEMIKTSVPPLLRFLRV